MDSLGQIGAGNPRHPWIGLCGNYAVNFSRMCHPFSLLLRKVMSFWRYLLWLGNFRGSSKDILTKFSCTVGTVFRFSLHSSPPFADSAMGPHTIWCSFSHWWERRDSGEDVISNFSNLNRLGRANLCRTSGYSDICFERKHLVMVISSKLLIFYQTLE